MDILKVDTRISCLAFSLQECLWKTILAVHMFVTFVVCRYFFWVLSLKQGLTRIELFAVKLTLTVRKIHTEYAIDNSTFSFFSSIHVMVNLPTESTIFYQLSFSISSLSLTKKYIWHVESSHASQPTSVYLSFLSFCLLLRIEYFWLNKYEEWDWFCLVFIVSNRSENTVFYPERN